MVSLQGERVELSRFRTHRRPLHCTDSSGLLGIHRRTWDAQRTWPQRGGRGAPWEARGPPRCPENTNPHLDCDTWRTSDISPGPERAGGRRHGRASGGEPHAEGLAPVCLDRTGLQEQLRAGGQKTLHLRGLPLANGSFPDLPSSMCQLWALLLSWPPACGLPGELGTRRSRETPPVSITLETRPGSSVPRGTGPRPMGPRDSGLGFGHLPRRVCCPGPIPWLRHLLSSGLSWPGGLGFAGGLL